MTSLAFPTGDVNNFIVGSEEGTVYTACRHGSRAGILDSFEGMIWHGLLEFIWTRRVLRSNIMLRPSFGYFTAVTYYIFLNNVRGL